MEVDRGRAADLKDAVHRDCAPTVLVLPTAPVCSFHPNAGDLHCALLRTSCVCAAVARLPAECVRDGPDCRDAQAEAIVRKNELSFIDLLRPFASVDTSSVAINTTREQPYRVPRMNLRFCESGEVAQPPEEFVDIVLDGVVRASAADARSRVSDVDGKEAAARLVQERDVDQLAPWFREYRQELTRGLRWTDLEYFDHPVAVVLVVSSCETDMVDC